MHIFSTRYIFHTNSYIRVLLGLISWHARKGAKLPLIKGGGYTRKLQENENGEFCRQFYFGFRSASKISYTNSYNRRQESWITVFEDLK